jgi:tetratricopeptide (TPR) repeat protein
MLMVLVLSSVSVSGGAVALAEDEGPPAYREAVEHALAEYGAKNYEEARTLFARAHAIAPSARTLRGMGMAAFELRRYPESVERLEAALRSNTRPLQGELRAETEALLERARGFVATVSVTLRPAAAVLVVDGNEVDASGPLTLPLGEHELEARLPGYGSERRKVHLSGGELLRVQLVLSPARADGAAKRLEASGSAGDRRVDDAPRKRPWLWAGVSVAVAGALGAAVAGALLATRGQEQKTLVASGTPNTPAGAFLALSSGSR